MPQAGCSRRVFSTCRGLASALVDSYFSGLGLLRMALVKLPFPSRVLEEQIFAKIAFIPVGWPMGKSQDNSGDDYGGSRPGGLG